MNTKDFDYFEEERKIIDQISEDYLVDIDFKYSTGSDMDIVRKDLDWSGPISACYTGKGIENSIEVLVCCVQNDVNKYTIKIIATTIDGVNRYEFTYPTFYMAFRALAFFTNQNEDVGCVFQINSDYFNISLGDSE